MSIQQGVGPTTRTNIDISVIYIVSKTSEKVGKLKNFLRARSVAVYLNIHLPPALGKEALGILIKYRVIQQLHHMRGITGPLARPQLLHQPLIALGRRIAPSHIVRACI